MADARDHDGRSPAERAYDRLASVYDWYEGAMDRLGGRARRRRIIGGAAGSVLEIGVGTCRNLEFYPTGSDLTGIDISARMLERARHRADALGRAIDLRRADAQAVPFPDGSFDTVTTRRDGIWREIVARPARPRTAIPAERDSRRERTGS